MDISAKRLFIPFVLLFVGLIALYITYFFIPEIGFKNIQYLGQTGDFFGGILNPIFGFFSFMALLYTIKIQLQALEHTRDQLEKSVAHQDAMENAAVKQRELAINIENYKFIRDALERENAKIDQLINELLNEPKINFESKISLSEIIGIATKHFMPKNKEDIELMEKQSPRQAFDSAISRAKSGLMMNEEHASDFILFISNKVSHLRILGFNFIVVAEAYTKICSKLDLEMSRDPVVLVMHSVTSTNLTYIYLLSEIYGDKYGAGDSFITDKQECPFLHQTFIKSLENFKLPSKAIEYFV
jgi:uncharacterized membrane protein